MRTAASGASRLGRRRWAILLAGSALFHAAVMSAFAFRMPAIRSITEVRAMDVALVAPPPFVRPLLIQSAPPQPARVVVLDGPPRYAPEAAPTGEAGDAADLFGPVFADGQWPRPVVVKSEPCEPKDEPERAQACRRELLIMGVAAGAPAGR